MGSNVSTRSKPIRFLQSRLQKYNHRVRSFSLTEFSTKLMNMRRKKKPWKVAIVGLDAAGKTAILYKLKGDDGVGDYNSDKIFHTIPTIGYNHEIISQNGMVFDMWDIGGQEYLRKFWPIYFGSDTHAVIFVVDSSDVDRIDEAQEEFQSIIRFFFNSGGNMPVILILANKQDAPNAMKINDIYHKLKLNNLDGLFKLVKTSTKEKRTLEEALEWLHWQLTKKYHDNGL